MSDDSDIFGNPWPAYTVPAIIAPAAMASFTTSPADMLSYTNRNDLCPVPSDNAELTAARARIAELDLAVIMMKGYIKIAADNLRAGEKPFDVAGFLNLVLTDCRN